MTLSTIGSVNIREKVGSVVPLLLFQRLLAAGDRCDELPDTYTYEISSSAPALFESPDLMRSANKGSLADSPTITESTKLD